MSVVTGHFVRVQSSGTWITGYHPPVADWLSFDQRSCQAINGDDGGSWAPLTPIVIGGQGVFIFGPTLVTGSGISSGTPIPGGILEGGTAGAFQLGDDTQIELGPTHARRKRTVMCSTLSALPTTAATVGPSLTPSIIPNVAFGSAQTVLTPGNTPIVFTVPLRIHDGATLSSVVVSWIVSTPHTLAAPPRFRVLAVLGGDNSRTPGVCYPVSSVSTGADVNGYFTPPVPGGGWFNNGQPQSFTIPVDGGGFSATFADNESYSYVLEIQEESGVTGFPFAATSYTRSAFLVSTINTEPLGGSTTIDGVLATAGTSVLLTNQADPVQNGLWGVQSVGTVTWSRARIRFDEGAIFYVISGSQQAGTYWQALPAKGSPSTSNGMLWLPSTAVTAGAKWGPLTGSVGLIAVCSTAGTTASSEPTWPTVPGDMITDGSAVWTMQTSPLSAPQISQLVDPNGLNTGCGAGFAAFGNIWLPVECNFTDIQDCRFE